MPILRAVIDTNVVFEGLMQQGGAAGLIVRVWLKGLFRPCVSNALLYEYESILAHELSERRWQRIEPVLISLLTQAEFVPIYYSWRPTSPDPGDDHVIDCAMNAGAVVVTSNVRHFQRAINDLGLFVATPVEWLERLIAITVQRGEI